STVVPATSSEGTGTKPGFPDAEKVTSEANEDTDEEEEKFDDDDDKSIHLEKTDDEETDDEFVHSEEKVQDDDEETDDELVHTDEQVNDDEDKEMTNAKDADMGNGDEEITDTGKPSVLTPITETPSVAPATTLLPPPFVSTITPVLLQTTTPIPTPPITTEAPPVTMIPDPLPAVIQRISILEKDVQELKEADNTITLRASLRSEIPSTVNTYLGFSLGDALRKVMNQLPKFLPKAVSDFATLVIQSTTIRFEKIDKSRSYQTHDKHQALYDALLNSLILDDDIARGQANVE
ncbi:hypothetical protein Tco_0695880, partial [Tanacetum coccineum]